MSDTTYIVKHGESLMDVAINAYGDSALVFELMADNPTITSTDEALETGAVLKIQAALASVKEETAFDQVSLATPAPKPRKQTVTVKPGQSITDLVMEQYGDMGMVFQLLSDNPELLDPDQELEAGTTLIIDTSQAEGSDERQFQFTGQVEVLPKPLFKQTTVYEGQSVLDLALQEYGDISAAIDMLLASNTENIGAWVVPSPGTSFSIRNNRVYDAEVTEYYQDRNIRINTGRRSLIEGIGLCSSDGVLLISFDNFILKASDQ